MVEFVFLNFTVDVSGPGILFMINWGGKLFIEPFGDGKFFGECFNYL